jgi:hypothetical protein
MVGADWLLISYACRKVSRSQCDWCSNVRMLLSLLRAIHSKTYSVCMPVYLLIKDM